MAIDFPNSPVNGTTYSFLGITYTYTDSGGGLGYWGVATAGNVGAASVGEIDAGTDNVKYVSPLGLDGSKYGTSDEVTGFNKTGKMQVKDGGSTGSSISLFGALNSWVSVGPDGSGATLTPSFLNDIPVGSTLILNYVTHIKSTLAGSLAELTINLCTAAAAANPIKVYANTENDERAWDTKMTMVPTDSSGVFNYYLDDDGAFDSSSYNVYLDLVGFIEP